MRGKSHFTSEQGLEQFEMLLKIIINWKVPSTAWLAIDFCFINKQTPQLLVLKIQTGSSFYLSAIYFRNSAKKLFTCTIFSYRLLLRQFAWNFWGTFIMSLKAKTGNFSPKYDQNYLLHAIFFKSRVILSANFAKHTCIYQQ